jgi:hypothetical protein
MNSPSNLWAYLRPVLCLCTPTILCFITFFFGVSSESPAAFFPLHSDGAMFLWSFIAPLFTVAAVVVLARRPNGRAAPLRVKIMAGSGIGLIVAINLFLAVGFWAAAYV